MEAKYRACVLAVFTNSEGQVLVAERVEPERSWQFPQGGIDAGESAEAAVKREMLEELGVQDVIIVKRSTGSIRYHFPPEMKAAIAKRYRGQDQIWFHLRLPPGAVADLAKASDKEFQDLAWVTPAEALKRVVSFKREAYIQGLDELGLLPRAPHA